MRQERSSRGWAWVVVLGLLLGMCAASLGPNSDLVVRAALGQAATGATLSVLAPPVEIASGGGSFSAARDGMSLKAGDQVRTAGGGVAVLTFFDGSETQVTPESQVEIKQLTQATALALL